MFVTHSEIQIDAAQASDLERAFRQRARLVDAYPGFVGLELLRDARKSGRYLLVTRWTTQDDFRNYMKSGDHAAAHERGHANVDSARNGAPLRQFDLVAL